MKITSKIAITTLILSFLNSMWVINIWRDKVCRLEDEVADWEGQYFVQEKILQNMNKELTQHISTPHVFGRRKN